MTHVDFAFPIGLKSEADLIVTEAHTAIRHKSGSLPVFATPAMIAVMEEAAARSVASSLPEGFTTVGTKITARHIAASPVGAEVRAVATLAAVEGKKLSFEIEVFDEVEKIGQGSHERYIIRSGPFMEKASGKRKT